MARVCPMPGMPRDSRRAGRWRYLPRCGTGPVEAFPLAGAAEVDEGGQDVFFDVELAEDGQGLGEEAPHDVEAAAAQVGLGDVQGDHGGVVVHAAPAERFTDALEELDPGSDEVLGDEELSLQPLLTDAQ